MAWTEFPIQEYPKNSRTVRQSIILNLFPKLGEDPGQTLTLNP
jgi:hypothetical protein